MLLLAVLWYVILLLASAPSMLSKTSVTAGDVKSAFQLLPAAFHSYQKSLADSSSVDE